MSYYQAPLDDVRFLLFDLFRIQEHYPALTGQSEFSQELADSILTEMGRFASGVLQPVNRSGDEEGCQYHPDSRSVTAPPSYREAFRQFVDNGWPALTAPTAFGGQGLPYVLGVVCSMNCAPPPTPP